MEAPFGDSFGLGWLLPLSILSSNAVEVCLTTVLFRNSLANSRACNKFRWQIQTCLLTWSSNFLFIYTKNVRQSNPATCISHGLGLLVKRIDIHYACEKYLSSQQVVEGKTKRFSQRLQGGLVKSLAISKYTRLLLYRNLVGGYYWEQHATRQILPNLTNQASRVTHYS